MTSGALVCFEGIDKSGKGTQTITVARRLEQGGRSVATFEFPRYGQSEFADEARRWQDVDEYGGLPPSTAALLYAGDRLAARPHLEDALATHDVVLLDRWVWSNLAHQSVRRPVDERRAFIDHHADLEFGEHRLPVPDLTIFLYVDPALIAAEIADDPSAVADGAERHFDHQRAASETYAWMARESYRGPWARVEGSIGDARRPIPEIADEILAHILALVPAVR